MRYDETGWTDSTWSGTGPSSKDQYRQITGLPIHMERMVLNGATIIDGPELIWADDFGESWNRVNDSEGYGCRSWNTKDQYVNDTLDFFRKVVDGTIRIPTRQEVIDRTKVVVIQDNNSGTDDNKYSTYSSGAQLHSGICKEIQRNPCHQACTLRSHRARGSPGYGN